MNGRPHDIEKPEWAKPIFKKVDEYASVLKRKRRVKGLKQRIRSLSRRADIQIHSGKLFSEFARQRPYSKVTKSYIDYDDFESALQPDFPARHPRLSISDRRRLSNSRPGHQKRLNRNENPNSRQSPFSSSLARLSPRFFSMPLFHWDSPSRGSLNSCVETVLGLLGRNCANSLLEQSCCGLYESDCRLESVAFGIWKGGRALHREIDGPQREI